MSASQKLRVGGVPEHFNLPWHLAIERGLFTKNGVEVEWTDIPNGTGAMVISILL
jgi:sulfonate transport system substrate-binding protein